MMKYIYIFLILSSYLSTKSQTFCNDSIDVVADMDANLGFHDGSNAINTNYDGAAHISAFWIPGVITPGGINGNRGIFHYNMSTIPTTATITSAMMSLYAYDGAIGVYNGHYGSMNSAYLQRITAAWTETTVTYSNQPTFTNVNQATLLSTSNPTLTYNVDVTNLTKDIKASGTNYGYLLKLVNEQTTNILTFCSNNYTNTAKRPRLKVNYITVCTGIEEHQNNLLVSVYPNPSNGSFIVKPINRGEKFKIEIYNFLGRQMYLSATLNEEVKVDENLPVGIYFLKISTESKEVIQKFVIQN